MQNSAGKKTRGLVFKMAGQVEGEGIGSQCGSLQVNSGDSELDEKIAEWLYLDKVTYSFRNIIHP